MQSSLISLPIYFSSPSHLNHPDFSPCPLYSLSLDPSFPQDNPFPRFSVSPFVFPFSPWTHYASSFLFSTETYRSFLPLVSPDPDSKIGEGPSSLRRPHPPLARSFLCCSPLNPISAPPLRAPALSCLYHSPLADRVWPCQSNDQARSCWAWLCPLMPLDRPPCCLEPSRAQTTDLPFLLLLSDRWTEHTFARSPGAASLTYEIPVAWDKIGTTFSLLCWSCGPSVYRLDPCCLAQFW
jgi:hypothetical protein